MNVIQSLSVKERIFASCFMTGSVLASMFTHECSHMIALRALTNADPYISCDFSSFNISFNSNFVIRPPLSITYDTCVGIIAAAGPLSDITLVAISSMMTWKMRHSNKKTALSFLGFACIRSLALFHYAANTFGSGGGDFAEIESHLGISHTIQIAITGSVVLGVAMLGKHFFSLKEPAEASSKKNI